MEFFLVRILTYVDWIRKNTDQKKLCIWAFFTQDNVQTMYFKPFWIHWSNHDDTVRLFDYLLVWQTHGTDNLPTLSDVFGMSYRRIRKTRWRCWYLAFFDLTSRRQGFSIFWKSHSSIFYHSAFLCSNKLMITN